MECFAFVGMIFMTDLSGGTAIRVTDATEFTTQLAESGKLMVSRSSEGNDSRIFTLNSDQIGMSVDDLLRDCARQADRVVKPLDVEAVGG